jgi:hypothetical protein
MSVTDGSQRRKRDAVILELAVLLVIVILAGAMIMFNLVRTKDQVGKLADQVPAIETTDKEYGLYKEALAAYSLGDRTPLDKWVIMLAESGKKGALPKLPSEYQLDRKDIVRVGDKYFIVFPN